MLCCWKLITTGGFNKCIPPGREASCYNPSTSITSQECHVHSSFFDLPRRTGPRQEAPQSLPVIKFPSGRTPLDSQLYRSNFHSTPGSCSSIEHQILHWLDLTVLLCGCFDGAKIFIPSRYIPLLGLHVPWVALCCSPLLSPMRYCNNNSGPPTCSNRIKKNITKVTIYNTCS